jgi:hypothetical protein
MRTPQLWRRLLRGSTARWRAVRDLGLALIAAVTVVTVALAYRQPTVMPVVDRAPAAVAMAPAPLAWQSPAPVQLLIIEDQHSHRIERHSSAPRVLQLPAQPGIVLSIPSDR